jgi:hypothetical protein
VTTVDRIINPRKPHEANHIAGLPADGKFGEASAADGPVVTTETGTVFDAELLSATELGMMHVD